MTALRVTAGSAILALAVLSCSGDDGDAATTTVAERSTTTEVTAPDRPVSTTTTAYDPAAVEGQVEAAYLRSWDVYADAVYNLELDEQALSEVYADEHLATKRNEIQRRIEEGRASWVRIEHDYTIEVIDPGTAIVVDRYLNHQVLVDPETKEPLEEDPNEAIADAVTLRFADGFWRVARKDRL